MQPEIPVLNTVVGLIGVALLMASLLASLAVERIQEQARNLNGKGPVTSESQNRNYDKQEECLSLYRSWKILISIQLVTVILGGFIFAYSIGGFNILVGMMGAVLFFFLAGFNQIRGGISAEWFGCGK